MLHLASCAALVVFHLAVVGCATPSSPNADDPTAELDPASRRLLADPGAYPKPVPIKDVPITTGMTPAQIEQVLGKPAEIRPMHAGEHDAEVWIYLRQGDPVVRQVTTGMREVPYVDPLTGVQKTLSEPIYAYVTETPRLELRLLVFQGSLVHWRQSVRGSDKTFSN